MRRVRLQGVGVHICVCVVPMYVIVKWIKLLECVSVYLLSRVSRQDGYRGEVGAVETERERERGGERTTWLEHHVLLDSRLMT